MRIYELARKLGVDTRNLLEASQRLGLEKTSPLSGVDRVSAQLLRDAVITVEPTKLALPAPPEAVPDQGTAEEAERATVPKPLGDDGGRRPTMPRLGPFRGLRPSPDGIGIVPEPDLESIGRRRSLFEGGVLFLIVFYLILNRAVPDRFVLPFGSSVRLYELVLVLILGVWVLWMIVDPLPFPSGLLGLSGLGLLLSLGLAPFVSAFDMTQFQANGAQRGLVRLFLFAGLFMASYHMSFRLRAGRALLYWVLGLTAVQALFSVWEFLAATPLFIFDELATSIGLIPDPNSIRAEFELFTRLTGEVRAVATAPHPIVLSAVVSMALLISAGWMVNENGNRARKWLILATVALVIGLPVANSRTGFVIVVAATVPWFILGSRNLARLIPWSLGAAMLFGAAFAISPRTPRLLLNSFTNPSTDPNTQVRIERFARVPELMKDHPFVGTGYLTHDPAIQIFDNAYNLAVVETGIIGLTLFVVFFVVILIRCWSACRLASPREAVLLFAGVVAAISVLVGGATFDAWTFDQFFPTALIVMGMGAGRSALIHRRINRPRAATAMAEAIR